MWKIATLSEIMLYSTIFYLTLCVVWRDAQTTQICRMSQNDGLRNQISDFWMFNVISLSRNSVVQCAVQCAKDERCITFMVNENSKRCRLHAAKVSEFNLLQSADGFVSYDTCRATSSIIGHPCEIDSSCTLQNTECVDHICQCKAGYSFSPRLKLCVKVCPEYGTEFVGFEHWYIGHHNDKDLTDPDSTCDGCCQNRCVEETSFQCRTMETMDARCMLSSVTKSDVPGEYYYDTSYDVTHYQRQCTWD